MFNLNLNNIILILLINCIMVYIYLIYFKYQNNKGTGLGFQNFKIDQSSELIRIKDLKIGRAFLYKEIIYIRINKIISEKNIIAIAIEDDLTLSSDYNNEIVQPIIINYGSV